MHSTYNSILNSAANFVSFLVITTDEVFSQLIIRKLEINVDNYKQFAEVYLKFMSNDKILIRY